MATQQEFDKMKQELDAALQKNKELEAQHEADKTEWVEQMMSMKQEFEEKYAELTDLHLTALGQLVAISRQRTARRGNRTR